MKNHKELYEANIISTTDGEPKSFESPAPGPLKLNGQHESYWILSETERKKGFIRPLRKSYQHVGIAGPTYPNHVRDLTEKEKETYGKYYAKYEEYPEGSNSLGRFWTQEQLDSIGKGCGTVTSMSTFIAETYARQPIGFYGSTFCVGCGTHLPVGEDGEFIWDDGSNERVGT